MRGDLILRVVLGFGIVLAAMPVSADVLLIANKSDDTVDLWDLDQDRSLQTLPTGNAPHEVAISPDGKLAVISNYGPRGEPGSSLTIIDLEDREVVRTIDLGEHRRPHGMVWFAKRKLAVTTEGSKHLIVVDPHRGRVVSEVETGQEISHMVAVGQRGRRAFVANIGSGSVTVVDLKKSKKLRDIVTGEGAEGIAITPDGNEVWVGNRGSDTLTVLDAKTLEILAEIPCPGVPIRVAITPDGERVLVSCAGAGEVALFDARKREPLVRRKLDFSTVPDAASRLFGDRFGDSPVPVGLVVSENGETAWVAATQADVVVAIDTRTLEVTGLIRSGHEPDGMARVR